jgi:hypothetical protein
VSWEQIKRDETLRQSRLTGELEITRKEKIDALLKTDKIAQETQQARNELV